AQLLENAPGALHVDLARHLHGDIVAVIVPAPRTSERIGIVAGARPAVRAGLAWPLSLPWTRHVLRAAAQRLERAALRVDCAIGIALAELGLGLAHRAVGLAEPFAGILTLLTGLSLLAELAPLLQVLEQLLELFTQRLLVLPQLAELARITLL